MPIPHDYLEIISGLLEKTNLGRVNWVETRFGMQIDLGEDCFRIWAGTDEQTDEPFVAFSLNDANDAILDSWYVDEGEPDYEKMRTLFSAARRAASGISKRLERFKKQLAENEIIGSKR